MITSSESIETRQYLTLAAFSAEIGSEDLTTGVRETQPS
jgi:hypothetical protein